jgi:hypothetical protein
MTTRRRRGLAGLLAATSLAAGSLVLATGPAGAAEGTNEDPHASLDNLPIEIINCNVEGAPGAFLTLCIEMTFNGGSAKFGKVSSAISGPIKVRQVVSAVPGPGGLADMEIVIVDEETEGGGGGFAFPTIDVPGGLLGNAALNDLLRPVTGVTATIQPLGELALNDLDPNILLAALFGQPAAGTLAVANLPLRVKVDNLLLGETCYIGSAADPVDLNLPLFLDNAEYWNSSFAEPQPEEPFGYIVFTADATDATFSIPAADGCGLLGVGTLLDSVSDGLNLFDYLVNSSVGLPAPAGTNLLSLQGYFGLTFQGQDGVPDPAPAP